MKMDLSTFERFDSRTGKRMRDWCHLFVKRYCTPS